MNIWTYMQVLPGTGIAIVNVSSSHSDQKMAASLADSECECPILSASQAFVT